LLSVAVLDGGIILVDEVVLGQLGDNQGQHSGSVFVPVPEIGQIFGFDVITLSKVSGCVSKRYI
jgi:hypothetical protein